MTILRGGRGSVIMTLGALLAIVALLIGCTKPPPAMRVYHDPIIHQPLDSLPDDVLAAMDDIYGPRVVVYQDDGKSHQNGWLRVVQRVDGAVDGYGVFVVDSIFHVDTTERGTVRTWFATDGLRLGYTERDVCVAVREPDGPLRALSFIRSGIACYGYLHPIDVVTLGKGLHAVRVVYGGGMGGYNNEYTILCVPGDSVFHQVGYFKTFTSDDGAEFQTGSTYMDVYVANPDSYGYSDLTAIIRQEHISTIKPITDEPDPSILDYTYIVHQLPFTVRTIRFSRELGQYIVPADLMIDVLEYSPDEHLRFIESTFFPQEIQPRWRTYTSSWQADSLMREHMNIWRPQQWSPPLLYAE